MSDVLTANTIVRHLSELGRELDMTVEMMKDAENDAAQKRHAADMTESRAFVASEGAMDMRKHLARIQAGPLEGEALVAEALARYLKTKIRSIETRIEIGRSLGAALRAELSALPYNPNP
jgi:hypothetical protein